MAPEDNDPVLDWPLARETPGREVWYGLVGPSDGSWAFWYRYTLLSTVEGHQEGRLWAGFTGEAGEAGEADEADGANHESAFASRAFPLEEVWPESAPFSLSVGDAELTSGSARGALETADGTPVEWELSYDPDPYSFTPLRSRRLTNALAVVAGTGKHWSANEAVRVSGTVRVGDREFAFDDVPGHQGHTLGSDPPQSWTWVQCNGFQAEENDGFEVEQADGAEAEQGDSAEGEREAESADESVALEALSIDGTLSVCLRRDGEVHALNRLAHVVGPRRNRTEHDEVGRWRFRARGEGVELTATVETDPDRWRRVAYKAPDESLRYNAHCSVSDVTLTYRVEGDGRSGASSAAHDGHTDEPRTLTSGAGRAEWVSAEPPLDGDYLPDWRAEPRFED